MDIDKVKCKLEKFVSDEHDFSCDEYDQECKLTIEEFIDSVKLGIFTDYDGSFDIIINDEYLRKSADYISDNFNWSCTNPLFYINSVPFTPDELNLFGNVLIEWHNK